MNEREGLEFSPTLGAIAKALAAAQGELEDAKKDSVNTFFKRSDGKGTPYASLASIRAAITPVFSKHGLAVVQYNEPHGDLGVCVVTLLMHTSGEWIKGRLFVPVTKKDAQGFGSALSYARRYALAQIANIATEEDDDANEAVKAPAAAKSAPAATASVDVDALVKALDEAKSAKDLSDASAAVGRVKDKLTKDDTARLRAAHDNRMRELEKAA